MTVLIFAATDVARILDHAQNSPGFMPLYDAPIEKPMVLLVGDQGVYLMSNGVPWDRVELDRRFVAYAKGMNPHRDAEWWTTKRAVYGGDDGVDALDMIEVMRRLIARGDDEIFLALSATTIRLIDLRPGDFCETPSGLGGVFRVEILEVKDGFATVQNRGNSADFDQAAPYRVPLGQLARHNALAARSAFAGAA